MRVVLLMLCLLLSAIPCGATLIFSDPLLDTSHGTPQYVQDDGSYVTLYRPDSWLKYTSLQLPSAAGTLACRMNVGPGFSGLSLISDSYGNWPSFVLHAIPDGATGKYRLGFWYWNSTEPGNWHHVTTAADLELGRWYEVGLSWGKESDTEKGQMIWVDGLLKAADLSYTKPYQHTAGAPFNAWGLGRVHSQGDPTAASHPASFADLRVFNSIEELGGTSPPAVPEPTSMALLACAMGGVGLTLRRRRKK